MEITVYDPAWYTERAKLNHRGLVPMMFLENAMPYLLGDIAGFVPKDARAMHGAGQATPFLEDGEEMPAAAPSYSRSVTSETDIARLDAIELSPAILTDGKLARIAMAKKLRGVPQNSAGFDTVTADEIIKAELLRRGTGGTGGTPGVMTSDNGTGPQA